MSLESVDAIVRGLKATLRRDLPGLNAECERSGDVARVVRAVEPLLAPVKAIVASPDHDLNRHDALRLLQLASIIVSSVERHMQTEREPKGAGVERLGMTYTLLRLGDAARHIPRDDHVLYWLDNRDEPLTFTGEDAEVLFNENVNLTQDLHSVTASAIREINDGRVPLASMAATEAIQFAATNTEKLHTEYRRFMEPSSETPGEWKMTKLFFMRMRQYLTAYPVDGTMWSGPNAANIIGQAQADFLTGLTLDFYRHIVEGRFSFLSEEEQTVLRADMSRVSLLDRLQSELGLAGATPTAEAFANRLVERKSLVPSARAIARLVTASGRLSGYHRGLIRGYLETAKFPPEVVAKAIVPPTHGTGAHDHSETHRIMEMRTAHPIGSAVVAAVRHLGEEVPVPVLRMGGSHVARNH